MCLVNLRPLLEDAAENKYAVGSFNVFNLETMGGVVDAAVRSNSPVVIAISERHLKYVEIGVFASMVQRIAGQLHVPMALHLDHAQSLETIIQALRCGFSSVMFDGFNLSYEEKVEQTKEVVRIAHSVNVTVEAELGHVTRVGQMDDYGRTVDDLLTAPDVAEDFAERTGVDVLAVAIGTVHGMGNANVVLDYDRLRDIRGRVGCYLSLHGGSGVDDGGFRRVIREGISKISYYTRVASAATKRIKEAVCTSEGDGIALPDIMAEVRTAVSGVVMERMEVFGSVKRLETVRRACERHILSKSGV